MRVPDPFLPGRFFEFEPRRVLTHAPEDWCPVCDFVRAQMVSASQTLPPVQETGFEIKGRP